MGTVRAPRTAVLARNYRLHFEPCSLSFSMPMTSPSAKSLSISVLLIMIRPLRVRYTPISDPSPLGEPDTRTDRGDTHCTPSPAWNLLDHGCPRDSSAPSSSTATSFSSSLTSIGRCSRYSANSSHHAAISRSVGDSWASNPLERISERSPVLVARHRLRFGRGVGLYVP